MRRSDEAQDEEDAHPMASAEYECIFATDEPFRGYRLSYNEDDGLQVRVWEARLPISADMIFADFDTPSGVQVCFSHDPYSRQSVGRVVSAKFAGGKMRGVVELSDADVRARSPAGWPRWTPG